MLQVLDEKYERNVEIIGGKPRLIISKELKPKDVQELISELWISPHGDVELLGSLARYLMIRQGLSKGIYNSNVPFNGK